jgi:hypothetical protein
MLRCWWRSCPTGLDVGRAGQAARLRWPTIAPAGAGRAGQLDTARDRAGRRGGGDRHEAPYPIRSAYATDANTAAVSVEGGTLGTVG